VSSRLVLHGLAALIAGHRDDRAAVKRHLTAVPNRPISAQCARDAGYLLAARALAAEQTGQAEQALAVLAPTIAPTIEPDCGEAFEKRYLWLPDMVRLAIAVGEGAIARSAAQACAADAAQRPCPRWTAATHHCRGLLPADAAPLLAAADQYRTAGRSLELGRTLEDSAVLLAGRATRTRRARRARRTRRRSRRTPGCMPNGTSLRPMRGSVRSASGAAPVDHAGRRRPGGMR